MVSPQPGAGWYRDPGGSGDERYWDGAKWTANTRRSGDLDTTNQPTQISPGPRNETTAAPGWYDNPDGTGGQRWWDGLNWTTARQSTHSEAGGPNATGYWDDKPPLIERLPSREGQSWLQAITEATSHSLERGSSRWIVGRAIVVAGAVLVVSAFLEWIAINDRDMKTSVSGLGHVSVTRTPMGANAERLVAEEIQRHVGPPTSNPGIWAVVVGLAVILAGGAFLWTRWRSRAALAVAVLSGIEFLFCLSNVINSQELFGGIVQGSGGYSLGLGLLLACGVALVLVGLGITAFVLDHLSV